MNTDDLEKLYKKAMNDTAPDFWDRIEKDLKPHSELTEEEKNAFAEFETVLPKADIKSVRVSAETGNNYQENRKQESKVPEGKEKNKLLRLNRPDRIATFGWIAAAVILILLIPSTILVAKRYVGSARALAEATAALEAESEAVAALEAEIEAAADNTALAKAAADNTALAKAAADNTALAKTAADNIAIAEAAAAPAEAAAIPEEKAAAPLEEVPAAAAAEAEAVTGSFLPDVSGTALKNPKVQLLSVPKGALTVSADAEYFSEEVLADTDMLAIVTVESAAFVSDADGHAYRLAYSVTVHESLLDDSESGQTGSRLRILSPIVSDGAPGGAVLYQLVPGQTYILPLKKVSGDWHLLTPCAPQIEMLDDGRFVFHTGYTSLINDDTEVITGKQSSDDDFWFDRKVSRSDDAFVEDLTELVLFEKKNSDPR